jgi:hypothetical protein
MVNSARPLMATVLVCLVACSPPRSSGATSESRPQPAASQLPTSVASDARPKAATRPADPGQGALLDGGGQPLVTVPGGTSTAEIVAALEAQRRDRAIALYWRHLLLHGTPSDAYLYINDPARSDVDHTVRDGAVGRALDALNLTETWRAGQPRPVLPNFESVAEELTTRSNDTARVVVLAANAARSVEGPDLVDVLIVYRPIYTDGSTNRTNRLVVAMDATFEVTNAYYF